MKVASASDFVELQVRVNSLTTVIEDVQESIRKIQARMVWMDEEEKENTNDLQQQMDEMNVTLQRLDAQINAADDSEKAKFKKWVGKTCPDYYKLFVENGVETLKAAKSLTESKLEKMGIKIGHLPHIMRAIQAIGRSEDDHHVHRHHVEGDAAEKTYCCN